MGTTEDLKHAFAGESQASRKYLAFAKKAEQDKFPMVARLFRAAAQAETVHAQAHFRVLGGVKDTAANLQDAAAGESEEFTAMYPPFVAEAKKEGNAAAERSFQYAMEVEKLHYALYQQALAAVKGGKDITATAFYVCPVCGYTVENQAPGKCPLCGSPKFDEVS